jgi:hypothetical protein
MDAMLRRMHEMINHHDRLQLSNAATLRIDHTRTREQYDTRPYVREALSVPVTGAGGTRG